MMKSGFYWCKYGKHLIVVQITDGQFVWCGRTLEAKSVQEFLDSSENIKLLKRIDEEPPMDAFEPQWDLNGSA